MNKGIIILLLLFLSPSLLTAQKEKNFRVMCWNVENLFDIRHDSLKNDYEFLPNALRHWNYTRYKKKLVSIARVITAVGEWTPPALVGLCEVENDSVPFKRTWISLCYDSLSRRTGHRRGLALSA